MNTIRCRLCNRDLKECGGWLARVNEKGVPGIFECRPSCQTELPQDRAVLGAILGDAAQAEKGKP